MNIGCDIVENERLKKVNNNFIKWVLTENEQKEYKKRGFLYLCGRFAAKEAIMKALPNTKKYTFLEFEILTAKDGSPHCTNNMDLSIKVSISHEKKFTIAVAIVN